MQMRNISVPSQEQADLEAYLSGNGINATKHPSGLYYEIVKSGGSEKPHLCSDVVINYKGQLTNGTTFDSTSTNPVVFTLGGLIEGWKIGLPLIGKGGEIRLYIPPALGYGYTDVKNEADITVIPGGSILIFSVVMQDFY
jgi:FKBP-type peptidyl-prolyl cis-trans isomerase FkpA